MGDQARDSAEDWTLPAHARPPLLGELVERIDEALAIARASEAAIGDFTARAARADRVAERLRRLQRLPLPA